MTPWDTGETHCPYWPMYEIRAGQCLPLVTIITQRRHADRARKLIVPSSSGAKLIVDKTNGPTITTTNK